MKIMGLELKEMGYTPEKSSEAMPMNEKVSEDPKPRYATIYADDRELPLNLKGYKAGDDVLLVAVAHIDELSTNDRDGDEVKHRVTFSIRQAAIKPYSSKAAADMSDDELEEAIEGKKGKKG